MTKTLTKELVRSLTGTKVAFAIFIATAGYYLWAEHQAHIVAALPYALFLLCPLMHLFMRHDHGDRHTTDKGTSPPPPQR